MKYTGRMALSIFLTLSNLVMWHIGNKSINYLNIIDFLLFFIIGWSLGKQYDKVKFYSEKDPLTNVYNRRFIQMISPKLLNTAGKNNEFLGISVVDVDNFKTLNDFYGHNFGDKILQNITLAILKATRQIDTVARWGGDEILIISPLMDSKCPKLIVERIENELKGISQQINVDLSVSIGTAVYPDDGTSILELINKADRNMYKFKLSKKDYSAN